MAKRNNVKESVGTGETPLRLAAKIADLARSSFGDGNGEMMSRVTPTTAELLKFWFCEPWTSERRINFHEGQKQSILNTIYLHEVLGVRNVREIYEKVSKDLLGEGTIAAELEKSKYAFPKYAVKMATGTGKTWVMHALLIWQYLNACAERHEASGRWTKNFLLVAPGLIVYDRLLDAYCGRVVAGTGGERDFGTSDLVKFKDLFLPPSAREAVFAFVSGSLVKKEEIGRKVTGDGLIALTNFHLFMSGDADVPASPSNMENTEEIMRALLPTRPGKSAGNSLEALDRAYLRGNELDCLAELPDMMVVNDEAHHIHENKKFGEIEEVEWQSGLNKIACAKGERFFQVDFSATPYDSSGSGANARKHFFPHVISDFPLEKAIVGGLVKMIAIDKRKAVTEDLAMLDFNAVRDGRRVVSLSDGQKLMLRAGLRKLKILEESFVKLDVRKSPKMLVMCEDTDVSPFVEKFLHEEGYGEESVLRVDSSRSGEVKEEEWRAIKERLFNVDAYTNPKIIISVLMLREGFDVNNICVIVPLRASNAPILQEQTIGRGLRQMWREPEYADEKHENRQRVLRDKVEPKSYLDILSIIEHPAFVGFYDELLSGGLAIATGEEASTEKVVGDLMKVGLKSGFERYDLSWPVVLHEAGESIVSAKIGIEKMRSYDGPWTLEQLREVFARPGETFVSNDILVNTRFGEYMVTANLFTAESYNEYLQRLLGVVLNRLDRVGARRIKEMPTLQINTCEIVALIDDFIRVGLFAQPFDPFNGDDWKILLARNGIVTEHIVKEIGKVIYEMQTSTETEAAKVQKIPFSSVRELRVRERFSLPLQKTIYERTPFPSAAGAFEKAFLEFLDQDAKVEKFVKIGETLHEFAAIYYLRSDGMPAWYHPDFIVATRENFYLIETKGQNMLGDKTVRRKCVAALEWCNRMNALLPEMREGREWKYALVGENLFYGLRGSGADIDDICERAFVHEESVREEFCLK